MSRQVVFEAIVLVDWNRSGALQGQAKATFAQAQELAKQGTAAYAVRDHDKARGLLMRSTELVAKAYGPKHVEVAKAMVRVAYPEMKLRNYVVARKVLHAALERFRAVMPEDHPAIADAMQMMGLSDVGEDGYMVACDALGVGMGVVFSDHLGTVKRLVVIDSE